MPMIFEELDETTRRFMIGGFEAEWANGARYEPRDLSAAGLDAFPDLMRAAIETGNEESLSTSLMRPEYWNPTRTYMRRGNPVTQEINVRQSSELLGRNEFNTWYVWGLANRLIDESVEMAQIYRAAPPKWEIAECSTHEGEVRPVIDFQHGHRARYWPEINDLAFSIPWVPGCHHTIRRYCP